jgi:3-deoxy-D-manno-octulosonic-acid transferase
MLAGRGHGVARARLGTLPGAGTAFYVADTVGELGLFYRLAPVVFMGRSLARGGGQNPLEAAALGAALAGRAGHRQFPRHLRAAGRGRGAARRRRRRVPGRGAWRRC